MNRTKVKLPFSEVEIEQLEGAHAVTEAADYLQQTIISNTNKSPLKGLELGSGNGIISLMLALQRPDWDLTGVEIQKEVFDLAESNACRTGVSCRFVNNDLRDYKTCLLHGEYDLIYSNPPWVKAGAGQISPDMARAVSRQEVSCTMKDILACIDWCLHPDGTAWVIYPVERKNELAREVRLTSLEVVNLFHKDEDSKSFVAKLKIHKPDKKWF